MPIQSQPGWKLGNCSLCSYAKHHQSWAVGWDHVLVVVPLSSVHTVRLSHNLSIPPTSWIHWFLNYTGSLIVSFPPGRFITDCNSPFKLTFTTFFSFLSLFFFPHPSFLHSYFSTRNMHMMRSFCALACRTNFFPKFVFTSVHKLITFSIPDRRDSSLM